MRRNYRVWELSLAASEKFINSKKQVENRKKSWGMPILDLKSIVDTVRVFGKYFVTVFRKKGDLGVCSQEPEVLG